MHSDLEALVSTFQISPKWEPELSVDDITNTDSSPRKLALYSEFLAHENFQLLIIVSSVTHCCPTVFISHRFIHWAWCVCVNLNFVVVVNAYALPLINSRCFIRCTPRVDGLGSTFVTGMWCLLGKLRGVCTNGNIRYFIFSLMLSLSPWTSTILPSRLRVLFRRITKIGIGTRL